MKARARRIASGIGQIASWLTACVVVLVVSLGLALVGIAHGWLREPLRTALEERMEAALGAPVAIGSLDGVLYREVALTGLRVGPADAPWLRASSLRWEWGDLSISDRRIEIAELAIESPHVRLTGDEPLLASGEPASTEVDAPPLALLVKRARISDGKVAWSPTDAAPTEFDTELSLTDLAFMDSAFTVGEARAEGNASRAGGRSIRYAINGAWMAESWRIDTLLVSGNGLDARASGRGDTTGIEKLDVEAEATSLEELLALAGVSWQGSLGSLETRVSLRGAWSELKGALWLRAEDVAIGEHHWTSLEAAASSEEPGHFSIERLALHGPSDAVEAEPGATLILAEKGFHLEDLKLIFDRGGTLAIQRLRAPSGATDPGVLVRQPSFELDVAAEDLDLARVSAYIGNVPRTLGGRASAELRVRGSPEGPNAAGWLALHSDGFAIGEWQGRGLSAQLDLGDAPKPPSGRLEVSIDHLERASGELGGGALDLQIDQNLRVVLESGRWEVAALRVDAEPGGVLRLDGSRVSIEDLGLRSGDQRVVMRGTADPARLSDFVVEITRLDLPWLRDALAGFGIVVEDETLAGTLRGQLQLNGDLLDPGLRGTFEGSDLVLSGVGIERVALTGESHGDLIRASTRWSSSGREVLELELRTSRQVLKRDHTGLLASPETQLGIRADEFDLSALRGFLPPAVDTASGWLSADVSLRGGEPPTVESGSFVLREGSLTLAGVKRPFAPIAATGEADFRGVSIEDLQIGPPDARVKGNASFGWPGTDRDDLSGELHFAGYTVRWPGVARGDVRGDLRLTGKLRSPVVKGDLVVSRVSIQLPDARGRELKEIRVRTAGSPDAELSLREERTPSTFDPVTLDLAVELERNSWVRGRGVEAEIEGQLKVEKNPGGTPSYAGNLRTLRGSYEIYGRRFQIRHARARLDGSDEIDPILDVRALHRVRAVRIFALLEGRLSDPKLRFESEPELTETDVASYLLLGRPASEAGARDQAALQSVAAQVGAGLAGNELERVLGRRLPVDLIDVRFEEGQEDERELAVGVGKYVGERTFLRYDRRFGREPVDEIHVEYNLTPRWSVESSAASDGEAGADILFRIDY